MSIIKEIKAADFKEHKEIKPFDMEKLLPQQSFTRKEVIALLKKQRQAAVHSHGTMESNDYFARLNFSAYCDDIGRIAKRLRNVKLIKF